MTMMTLCTQWRFQAIAVVVLSLGGSAVQGCSGLSNCDAIEQDARSLRNEFGRCASGDACELVDMYALVGDNNCIGSFQCSAAFRRGSDVASFQRRARKLVEDYEGCSKCTQAGCPAPLELEARCNEVSGLCEVVLTR
jgi:hypothetical protein